MFGSEGEGERLTIGRFLGFFHGGGVFLMLLVLPSKVGGLAANPEGVSCAGPGEETGGAGSSLGLVLEVQRPPATRASQCTQQ